MAANGGETPRIPDEADTLLVLDMIARSNQPIQPSKGFMLESLASLLNMHMGKRGMSTDVLFERIGMNRATGYRIMNGQRRPSRNALICLALELQMDYSETQKLLKVGRLAQLSPRDSRDLLILHGIMHNKGLGDTDAALADAELEPLIHPL